MNSLSNEKIVDNYVEKGIKIFETFEFGHDPKKLRNKLNIFEF